MSDFQTIAKTTDIPEGQGRCFPVRGTMVGVFRHAGTYFAINDFCPHMGASLADGHVTEEGAVMCPWHAWCFSLSDGTWLDNSKSGIKTTAYDLRVVDDEIQVNVPLQDPPKTETRDSQPGNPDAPPPTAEDSSGEVA